MRDGIGNVNRALAKNRIAIIIMNKYVYAGIIMHAANSRCIVITFIHNVYYFITIIINI